MIPDRIRVVMIPPEHGAQQQCNRIEGLRIRGLGIKFLGINIGLVMLD